MKAPKQARRNTSALPPLIPDLTAYPELQASPQEWEKAARRRRRTQAMSKRINDLCCILRLMDGTIQDLTKRLKFVENAVKLTAGPR